MTRAAFAASLLFCRPAVFFAKRCGIGASHVSGDVRKVWASLNPAPNKLDSTLCTTLLIHSDLRSCPLNGRSETAANASQPLQLILNVVLGPQLLNVLQSECIQKHYNSLSFSTRYRREMPEKGSSGKPKSWGPNDQGFLHKHQRRKYPFAD